jgi:DNA-binding CsgD family transcriptional regulator
MSRLPRDLLDDLRRSPNPAYATDENNRIIAWNRAAERLLGHRADAALGKECHALVAGTDIFGNTFCDRECSVLKMVRRNQVVKRFDMNARHSTAHALRVHCAILVVPGASASRFSIVHLLEEAAKEAPRWKARRAGSIPDPPSPQPSSSGARARLTPREHQVLRMISEGAGTREIADSLSVSSTTVRTHVRNLLHKMGVHSRLEAVVRALQDGLI